MRAGVYIYIYTYTNLRKFQMGRFSHPSLDIAGRNIDPYSIPIFASLVLDTPKSGAPKL